MKKLILILFIAAITVVVVYTLSNRSDTVVPVLEEFPEKIVYTTDAAANLEPFRTDCATRGGRLNTCGSMCAPDAEACAAVCAIVCELNDKPNGNVTNKNDLIRVTYPQKDEIITSPITIRGEARGYWFFEANFPIFLADTDGNIFARHYAEAEGEWMTEDFVPFFSNLEFEVPEGVTNGILILGKSNASGLPEHDDELIVPISFR